MREVASIRELALAYNRMADLEENLNDVLNERVEMKTKIVALEDEILRKDKKIWALELVNKDILGFLEDEHKGLTTHDPSKCDTCIFIRRLKE